MSTGQEANDLSGAGTGPSRSTGPGCWKSLGITCLVAAVIGVGLLIWGVLAISKNPIFKKAMSEAQLLSKCQIQLREIGGALRRYESRHGKFPASLEELHPNFLEDRAMLHCPADKRDVTILSYEYTPAGPDAPGSTTVATCRLHVLVEGQPPAVVNLTKDGKVATEEFQRHRGPLSPR